MMSKKLQFNPFATDIQTYINMSIKKALKELQICIPAIIKEVKSREQVIVSPAVQQTSADWQVLPWADILLPVYTPAGGKGIFSLPVSAGDTGWIIAGDLDPSLFMQDPTKPARQNVFDRHNYQYGFFLPAKMKDFGIDQTDDGGIVIKNGNTKIVVKENEIEIKSNNTLKINANSVNITSSGNNIVIDGTNFKNHKHSVGTLQVPTTAPEGSPSTITGRTGGVN
jgi:hypothetical protein